MTIQELIQKMKDSKMTTYGVLELFLERYNNKNENNDVAYGQITGFIWGLYSTGFITDDEKDCLINYLINN